MYLLIIVSFLLCLQLRNSFQMFSKDSVKASDGSSQLSTISDPGYNVLSVLYWHTRGAQVIHTGKSPIRTNVTTLFYALTFFFIYIQVLLDGFHLS